MKEMHLYGGAAKVQLPSDWIDASRLREVPSHQEVFVNECGSESVIIEILEYQRNVPDDKAGAYFFVDLAQADEATDWTITGSPVVSEAVVLGSPAKRISVWGTQVKAKSGLSSVAHPVAVFMTVLRCVERDADILVTSHFADPAPVDHNRSVHLAVAESLEFTDPNLFA